MTKYDPHQYFCVFCLIEGARVQAEYFKGDLTGFEQPVCEKHCREIDRLIDTEIERSR